MTCQIKKIKIEADKYKLLDIVYDEKLREILDFVNKLEKQINEKNIGSTNSGQSTSTANPEGRNTVNFVESIFKQLEYIKQFSGEFLEFQNFFEPLVNLLDKSGISNEMKIKIILEKLDPLTQKTLKDHFYDEFEMQERILKEFQKEEPSNDSNAYNNSKKKNYHEKVKKYCYICSRSTHSTMDCYSKIPPQMKKEIILTNNLCLNCFEFGHKAKFCFSPRRCLNCKNKHHVFFCNVGVKHEFNQTTKQSTSKLNQQTKPMLTYIQNVQNQKKSKSIGCCAKTKLFGDNTGRIRISK